MCLGYTCLLVILVTTHLCIHCPSLKGHALDTYVRFSDRNCVLSGCVLAGSPSERGSECAVNTAHFGIFCQGLCARLLSPQGSWLTDPSSALFPQCVHVGALPVRMFLPPPPSASPSLWNLHDIMSQAESRCLWSKIASVA